MNQNGHLPFEIVLLGNPVTAVDHITFIGSDGEPHTLLPGQDFVADLAGFPARVHRHRVACGSNARPALTAYRFSSRADSIKVRPRPKHGMQQRIQPSPRTLCQILPTSKPATRRLSAYLKPSMWGTLALMVSHWYFNREPIAAGTVASVPHSIDQLIQTNKIHDFSLGISATL